MHRFPQRGARLLWRCIWPEEIEYALTWEAVPWMCKQEKQQGAGAAPGPGIDRQCARTDSQADRTEEGRV
jgi:hypothetical protein